MKQVRNVLCDQRGNLIIYKIKKTIILIFNMRLTSKSYLNLVNYGFMFYSLFRVLAQKKLWGISLPFWLKKTRAMAVQGIISFLPSMWAEKLG